MSSTCTSACTHTLLYLFCHLLTDSPIPALQAIQVAVAEAQDVEEEHSLEGVVTCVYPDTDTCTHVYMYVYMCAST